MNRFLPSLTVLLAFLCSACTSQGGGMTWIERWGNPAPVTGATRTIRISPDTTYANVTGGEVIKFVEGEKSFAWHFNGPGTYIFDLMQVAPAGTLDHHVMVYVDPDPTYAGGR